MKIRKMAYRDPALSKVWTLNFPHHVPLERFYFIKSRRTKWPQGKWSVDWARTVWWTSVIAILITAKNAKAIHSRYRSMKLNAVWSYHIKIQVYNWVVYCLVISYDSWQDMDPRLCPSHISYQGFDCFQGINYLDCVTKFQKVSEHSTYH